MFKVFRSARKRRIFLFHLKSRLRSVLLLGLLIFIVVQVVAFIPASVDDGNSSNAPLDPQALIDDASGGDQATLAAGVPKGRIPEYSVDGFVYVSTQNGEKQWKLHAQRAHFYSRDQVVHARQVRAILFDPDGKATEVTGLEAKYSMSQSIRDLEIYGNVHTVFPDGFQIFSEYLRYMPQTKQVEITTDYPVSGNGLTENKSQRLSFTSMGLNFDMAKSEITLPKASRVKLEDLVPDPENKGMRDETLIESDRCVIHRKIQIANFTMEPSRPVEERFVHITQPKLFAKGRRADLNYGDFAEMIHYMTAYEDVLLRDLSEKPSTSEAESADPQPPVLQYATAGRADFEKRRDIIVLTELPQVYQDSDTVTGDLIIMHRDTNVVEINHSNSFTQGTQNSKSSSNGSNSEGKSAK